eukprot:6886071-Ditylum_brightwellii.AAC.1
MQGKKTLQPRTQWMKDITLHMHKWKNKGEVMIVNANSGLEDLDFGPFVAEIGICDVLGAIHGQNTPNTHVDGSKTIDFIRCTPSLL